MPRHPDPELEKRILTSCVAAVGTRGRKVADHACGREAAARRRRRCTSAIATAPTFCARCDCKTRRELFAALNRHRDIDASGSRVSEVCAGQHTRVRGFV